MNETLSAKEVEQRVRDLYEVPISNFQLTGIEGEGIHSVYECTFQFDKDGTVIAFFYPKGYSPDWPFDDIEYLEQGIEFEENEDE